MPLNIAYTLLWGQSMDTKSDTIRVPKDTMETFGEWLQQQRSQRRLTREEFAKRIGCSVSALRKIEYGVRRPSAQIAELMANCLDVPLEERSTFVRVARGALSVDRLRPEPKLSATPNVPPPSAYRSLWCGEPDLQLLEYFFYNRLKAFFSNLRLDRVDLSCS